MIFYISSEVYNEIIRSTIEASGNLILGQEVGNEIFLLKYIKQHIATMNDIEQIVIDLSAVKDTDEEILQALENYRMMYSFSKIVIVATNRRRGDSLLKKLFQLGIYNIVLTDDYLVIKEELRYCIETGKTFRDAVMFKAEEEQKEKILVTQEIRQVVNKIFIAVAGSEARMGSTHTSIMLASALRSKGFMVAVAECNDSKDFRSIMNGFDEHFVENDYFSIGGIDFYPERQEDTLAALLGKSYNFVIGDFGSYLECDRVSYNKANVRLMICGSKPYEMEEMQKIFEVCPEEMLLKINFLFNFTYPEHEHDIREGMKTADNRVLAVDFIEYTPYPYNAADLAGMERFLAEFLPMKPAEKKKGIFGKRKK